MIWHSDTLAFAEMIILNRRNFIIVVGATAGGIALLPVVSAVEPLLRPDSYDCDCGLVTYFRQPEGHYAASHFAGQRFTYALFRQHQRLHEKMAERT